MVSFVRKRLQVFVSSTFTDLIQERQAAVEAILTAGHIPAGMELFTAGDESQMEVIKQWIDESDVYLMILAGRYGSIEPTTGKSYTHLEYEYADHKSKPLFACVINESALELRVKNQIETANPKQLEEFRKFVCSKLVKFWDDSKDIKIAVGETLSTFARRDDLAGWVRAEDELNAPAVAEEITRLSRENAELRKKLSALHLDQNIHGLSLNEMRSLLENKGLLETFLGSRGSLADGVDPKKVDREASKALKEFEAIGLTEFHYDRGRYRLTEQGRMFLNRAEFSKVQKAEPVRAKPKAAEPRVEGD